MLLLLAALPSLLWDAGPNTAAQLREAGITRIAVPEARLNAWSKVTDLSVEAAKLEGAVKLDAPSVDYKINRGGASGEPWLNSSGWQFARAPHGRFYYDTHGPQAAFAAAEAFLFGADVMIRTDAAGVKPLGAMLQFLRSLPAADLPPIADIGFVDDGSPEAGEVMNLMVRSNLLFRTVAASNGRDKVTVKLGSPEYPLQDAADPTMVAHEVRAHLTDDRRSVRIYGSQVVVGRVYGSAAELRVVLLNYAGMERNVNGIRVRVLGKFRLRPPATGAPEMRLLDFSTDGSATEFTVPELSSIAVIDLVR